MIFQELVQDTPFEKVWPVLSGYYHLEEKQREGYENAYRELSVLGVVESPRQCGSFLTGIRYENPFEEGDLFEISGYSPKEGRFCSPLLLDWRELLSMRVCKKSLEDYGAVNMAAHCLHEITYYGMPYAVCRTQQTAASHFIEQHWGKNGESGGSAIQELLRGYLPQKAGQDAKPREEDQIEKRNQRLLMEFQAALLAEGED